MATMIFLSRMLKINKTLIILLLIMTKGFSQIDSTALSFYPLSSGNYWEYKETIFEGTHIYSEHYFTVQVIGDTLLENGKTYKILKQNYLDSLYVDYHYERVDSITGNVFRYNNTYPFYEHDEYLIDSLKLAIGDTCYSQRLFHHYSPPRIILSNEDIKDIFDQNLIIRTLFSTTWIPGYEYQLAQKIGLIKLTAWGETRSTEINLQYANIDGTEYGERIEVGITAPPQRPIIAKLNQNYPNPFNSSTSVSYTIIKPGFVILTLLNIKGQKVTTLFEGMQKTGLHTHRFYINQLSSGIYFIRMEGNDVNQTMKINLIR